MFDVPTCCNKPRAPTEQNVDVLCLRFIQSQASLLVVRQLAMTSEEEKCKRWPFIRCDITQHYGTITNTVGVALSQCTRVIVHYARCSLCSLSMLPRVAMVFNGFFECFVNL